MIKKNKWKLILSSAAILLPFFVGLIFWKQLSALPGGPNAMLTPVMVMPLVLLVFQWICVLLSAKDIKGAEQNQKVFSMVGWIIPAVFWFACGMIYATALGNSVEAAQYSCLLFGILFTVLGNYMPKCKQSFTTGIKIKWTLANEENWYATHRFAGKLWMISGLLVMACTFLPLPAGFIVMFVIMAIDCALPVIYSYRYYQKQVKEGRAPEKAEIQLSKNMKTTRNVTLSLVAVLLVGIFVFVFGIAGFELQYGETSVMIDATGWEDVTIHYANIESIEYRESCSVGMRTYGFGDVPFQMGIYTNSEFGSYTRFAYSGGPAVVLKVDGKTIVLGGKDAQSTKTIYDEILQRMGNG